MMTITDFSPQMAAPSAKPEPPPLNPTFIQLLLAMLGGMSRDARWSVGPQEMGDFVARGCIALAAFFAGSVGFSVIGHSLYGDQLSHALLIGLALTAAAFATAVDVCFFFRFPLHRQGLKELARGGLMLPRQWDCGSVLATCLRVTTGIVTGAVVGLFVSMHAYAPDLKAKILATYLFENRAIAEQFASLYDASTKRETAAIEDDTASLRDLDRQIAGMQQNETRINVRARRKGAPTVAPSANSTLTALEAKRSQVAARLEARKANLATLIESRNAQILKAIDSAPNHQPKRDGFLGRLTAFAAIMEENPRLLIMVIAIEVIALSLELAPVVAHFRYVPSTFAAYVALEHLKSVTRLSREGAAHLHAVTTAITSSASTVDDAEASASPSHDAPADQPTDHLAPPPPPLPTTDPPKRGRGRPRKPQPSLNGHDRQSPLTSATS